MDKLKGYKTILMNIVMGALALLAVIYPDLVLDKVAIADSIEQIFAGIAVLWTAFGVALRAVTDSPMFKRGEDP